MKVYLKGIESGLPGKDFYLLLNEDHQALGDLVEDTFDSAATLTVTLLEGQKRSMPGTGDLAADVRTILREMLQDDIEIML